MPTEKRKEVALSPGDRLLLEASGSLWGDEGDNPIFPESFSLGQLFEKSRRHGLLPQVYRWAQSHYCLPALSIYKDELLAISHRNLIFKSEYQRLKKLFEASSIALLPYKGIWLAEKLYDSIAERPMQDLDILILPADIKRTRDLLLRSGFDHATNYTVSQQKNLDIYHHEHGFIHREFNYRLEIHTGLFQQRFGIAYDYHALFAKATPDREIGDNDLFYLLCLHAYKDGWYRLMHVADMCHLFMSAEDLGLDDVLRVARKNGMRQVVLVNLCLLNQLYPQCEQRLQGVSELFDQKTRCYAEAIIRQLFELEGVSCAADNPVALFKLHCVLRDTLWQRLRMRWAYLTLPSINDVSLLDLPRCLRFIYWILRPLRLIALHFR